MKAYIFLAVLIIAIPLILIGLQEVPSDCDCKGVGTNICLGKVVCGEENSNCIPLTCELKNEFLGINESKITSSYTVLIIDASKSMEGENLDATIKASKEFVQKIETKEHIAIIEFNENAQVLTDFSNDKLSLFSSVELINPKGRTRFLEPFTLANRLFEGVPTQANKYILFLSDGEPEDKEELFLEQIQKLREQNVHIYAIAFEGKSNEQLMNTIASHSSNLFLVKTAEDIQEKFVEAYTNIREGRDMEVSISDQPKIATTQDVLKGTIYSKHTLENLLAQKKYCSFSTSNYLEVENERQQFSRIKGEIEGEKISFPLHELSSGTYDITAHSRILLDGCSISSSAQLDTMQIVSKDGCVSSCEDIDSIMKGNKTQTYVRENNQGISWTILIDKSSSMETKKYLEKAIHDTKKIVSLLPVQDTISIGSFDTKTELLSYYEKPFEFDLNLLDTIVSSASTNLRFAFEKSLFLEQLSPHRTTHTIILSDGKYGEDNLNKINSSLSQIKGCISTINYGVHLLTHKEIVHELIEENRNCGSDLNTQPNQEELMELVKVNLSKTPELIVQIKETNSSEFEVEVISSFTGLTPIFSSENCQEKPTIEITTIDVEGKKDIVKDSSFYLGKNETYSIKTFFEHNQCSYTATKQSNPTSEQPKNAVLKIILIVMIVLVIHLAVFALVMNKKLKKLEQMVRRRK